MRSALNFSTSISISIRVRDYHYITTLFCYTWDHTKTLGSGSGTTITIRCRQQFTLKPALKFSSFFRKFSLPPRPPPFSKFIFILYPHQILPPQVPSTRDLKRGDSTISPFWRLPPPLPRGTPSEERSGPISSPKIPFVKGSREEDLAPSSLSKVSCHQKTLKVVQVSFLWRNDQTTSPTEW
jgi:hypothetical protein